jgi:DNA-binding transcriptional LysR family regulator
LLARLRPALDEIGAALETTIESRDRPAGNLRITAPRFAADLIIAPRLGRFLDSYPEITLEIVDEDGFTDIVMEGFDAGIRLRESLDADMIAVKIGPDMRSAVVAAPSYFARYEIPSHPDDLKNHRCIRRRFSNGTLYHWEFEKDGVAITAAVNGPLVIGEDRPIQTAALAGAGLAYAFEMRVIDDIAAGRLIRVLEDWCEPYAGAYLYYPSRRQMRPALRAFIDFFRVQG